MIIASKNNNKVFPCFLVLVVALASSSSNAFSIPPKTTQRCRQNNAKNEVTILKQYSFRSAVVTSASASVVPTEASSNEEQSPPSDRTAVITDKPPPPQPLPSTLTGVIFDMDGTLLHHAINFPEMRSRIYAVADADPIGVHLERECILALVDKLSPQGQDECQLIFREIEQRAIDDMKVMEGGLELIRYLKGRGIKIGVLTRNLERNVQFMVDMYQDGIGKLDNSNDEMNKSRTKNEPLFDTIVARDSTTIDKETGEAITIPAKPNPDGILHICKLWNVPSSSVIMVGDSANDDMTAANRANCGGAVLLTQPGGTSLDTDSGYSVGMSDEEVKERTPSLRVESLTELRLCLEELLLGDQNADIEEEKEERRSKKKNVAPPL